jgi:hypothetical protein
MVKPHTHKSHRRHRTRKSHKAKLENKKQKKKNEQNALLYLGLVWGWCWLIFLKVYLRIPGVHVNQFKYAYYMKVLPQKTWQKRAREAKVNKQKNSFKKINRKTKRQQRKKQSSRKK